jgi:hypothetical protein
MAGLSFRDRFFTAPVARAIMSPLGLLLFGGVSAGSILAGVPIPAGIGIGVAAWAAKVGLSIPRNKRQNRVDPYTLSEPWKQYVMAAQSAKLRFDRTVAGTRDGAIKDRLSSMATRLDDGIADCWRIASRGDDIDKALGNLTTQQAQGELVRLQREAGSRASIDSTIASLQAQVESAQRMQSVSQDARDKLQALDARLDELVARATEVSVGASDSGVLSDDVDGLVTELESLRQALDVTDQIDTASAPSVPAPTPASNATRPPSQGQTWPPTS